MLAQAITGRTRSKFPSKNTTSTCKGNAQQFYPKIILLLISADEMLSRRCLKAKSRPCLIVLATRGGGSSCDKKNKGRTAEKSQKGVCVKSVGGAREGGRRMVENFDSSHVLDFV